MAMRTLCGFPGWQMFTAGEGGGATVPEPKPELLSGRWLVIYLETDVFFFTPETNPAVTFPLSDKVISCELCATRKAENHPHL